MDILSKIRECRRHIAGWKKKVKTNSDLKIKELKRSIHSLTHKDHFPSQELGELKHQLNRAYREEEEFWKQQSMVTWLTHGDKLSKYFFSVAKQRQATNRINHLVDDDSGLRRYSEEEMAEVVVRYFSKLFSSEVEHEPDMINSLFFQEAPIKVSNDQNDMMLSQISDQEVKEAVFDIGAEKTPGPDGLSTGPA